MIENKKDLKYYIEQDRLNLHIKNTKPKKNDIIWKYEIILRKHEYYHNLTKKNIFQKIKLKYYSKKHFKLSTKYTTSIPINTTGPGLSIAHLGAIYINSKARAGKNLRIQTGVVIGGDVRTPNKQARLGDNVYIGVGAKIIGPRIIANDVAIGANAVVTKDILEPHTTWAGVPAKKISDNSSRLYIDKRLFPEDPIYDTVDLSTWDD